MVLLSGLVPADTVLLTALPHITFSRDEPANRTPANRTREVDVINRTCAPLVESFTGSLPAIVIRVGFLKRAARVRDAELVRDIESQSLLSPRPLARIPMGKRGLARARIGMRAVAQPVLGASQVGNGGAEVYLDVDKGEPAGDVVLVHGSAAGIPSADDNVLFQTP